MVAFIQRSQSVASSAARVFALILVLLTFVAIPMQASDAAHEGGHASKGLPAYAPTLPEAGFVNNSMIVTWIVAALVIFGVQRAMRNRKQVPSGGQNFVEFLVEGLHGFLSQIMGRDLARQTFWFFASLFLFILATNWAGLLPGVGTIGWSPEENPGSRVFTHHLETPLFRGGNADLNMTSAMAVTFFFWWIVWALKSNGPVGFFKHIFAPKGKTAGFMKYVMILIFGIVGVLEVVSILFRPVSLSFRLYGNVFAGETMLESMQGLVPSLGWLIPIPFYFMELLVGLVQALVFMLLTSVFTLLICEHSEDHGHDGDEGHGDGDKAKAH
jgi:F-type H+-transporting ATPase subunit a